MASRAFPRGCGRGEGRSRRLTVGTAPRAGAPWARHPGGRRGRGGRMPGTAAVRPLFPVEPGLPCPLRTLTGVPCPFCGMTRSVTAAVHGDLAHSLVLNPAGIVAVVL